MKKIDIAKHTPVIIPFALGLILMSAFSLAQDNRQDELEIISVTATKSALSLSKTPSSVSTVLNEEIAIVSPQHINQILDAIPGTWISRGNGQEHLTAIRSPVLTGAGSCGAFFMGLDGISIRAPGFCNANQLFDINYEQSARVDVLRSPASTLYGANALHGVINVITQDPAESVNALSIDAGAYGFIRLSNSLAGRKTNRSWVNLVNLTKEEGYQAQSGYAQQKMTHILQVVGSTWANKTVIDLSNLNQETAGFIRGFESFKDDELRRSNPNPEAFRDVKSLRAYSSFSRLVNANRLTITPYLRYNEMDFLQHFLPWQALEQNSHYSLGLQSKYEYEWLKVQWLSGIDSDFTKASLKETQKEDFSPSIPAGLHYDYRVNAAQLSAYTQGLMTFDQWAIRFGARLEHNRYDYDNLTDGPSACALDVDVCRFSRPEDQRVDFTAISPSLNIQYSIDPKLFVYAKYAQGYRAPQATELFRLQNNQQVTDIDNESMDAFEIGLRYSSQQTSVHMAAFDMKKSDVIFQDSNRQNVSGAKTDHQGIEIELRHTLGQFFSIEGHLSYAKHEYGNNATSVNSSIKGNVIDTAPKYLSNLRLNYFASEQIHAQLSWQYISEYFLDPQNTAEYEGHQLFDANVNWQASDTIKVGLRVLNILDEDYAERADFAFGSYRYFVGQPRRAFIHLNWSY